MSVEKVYWFAVNNVPTTRISELDVERFDTLEQAQLYAAATGWYIPFADYPHGEHMNDPLKRRIYATYLDLSRERK